MKKQRRAKSSKPPRQPRTPKVKKHKRVVDTLTGSQERQVLQWLSAHMPAWVTPDHLTGLGLLGSVIIAISYGYSGQYPTLLWLAVFGFFLNWFGDSLDGTLARYRKIERPRYGFFIDHSVDAISAVMIFFSLGYSPYLRFDIASLALVGYLLLIVFTALSAYSASEFKISYAYLGPTEIRLIAIIGTIGVFFNGMPYVHLPIKLFGITDFTFLDLITMGLVILFCAAYLLSTIDMGLRLARDERPQNYLQTPFVKSEPSPQLKHGREVGQG